MLVFVLVSVSVVLVAVTPLLMMLMAALSPSCVITLSIFRSRLRVALIMMKLILVLIRATVCPQELLLMFIVVFMIRWLVGLPAVLGKVLDPRQLPMATRLWIWPLLLMRGSPLTPRWCSRSKVLFGLTFRRLAIKGVPATTLVIGIVWLLLNCTLWPAMTFSS